MSVYYILRLLHVSTQLIFLATLGVSIITPFLRRGNSLRIIELTQVHTRIKHEYFWLPSLQHSGKRTDSPSKLLEKVWVCHWHLIIPIPRKMNCSFSPSIDLPYFSAHFQWYMPKINKKQIITREEAWLPPFSFGHLRTGCLEKYELFGVGFQYSREGFRLYLFQWLVIPRASPPHSLFPSWPTYLSEA